MTHTKATQGRAPEGAAPDPMAADGITQGETFIPRSPPPDHADHIPAGDPGCEWRRRRRWLDAPGFVAPGAGVLRGLTANEVLDVHFAAVEWLRLAPCPEVAAYAERMNALGEVLLRRDTDEAGRTRNLGQSLGLVPVGPGGLSAGQAIALRRRNALLKQARAAHTEWRNMTDRQAARAMLAALARYRAGGWQIDRGRDTAPAGDPVRACFWRILRLGVAVPGSAEGMVAALRG
jgi:hypothetical protein